MTPYDAVLVLGGGLRDDGSLPPWVEARMDLALARAGGALIISCSAGTPHHKRNGEYESVAGARYLIQRGCDPARVLLEWSSYDTIGNAYFARTIHTDPAEFARLLVVTSEFHMPRTKALFAWVFSLAPRRVDYRLDFAASPDAGISAETLAARHERERWSLDIMKQPMAEIATLAQLHHWIYSRHGVYSAAKLDHPKETLDPRVAGSY